MNMIALVSIGDVQLRLCRSVAAPMRVVIAKGSLMIKIWPRSDPNYC